MDKALKLKILVDGSQKAVAELTRISSAAETIDKKVSTIGASGARAAAGIEELSGKIALMGHLTAGLVVGQQLISGVQAAGRALFEASAGAERLRTQLDFSTGNSARELAYLAKLSNQVGLEFAGTAKAYAGFSAAARGTALEGQKARDVFEAIAKASAVMGLSAGESSGALLAIQQMMAKGVVSAEEFRGQLGERMPIALQAGARALNVTTAEFSALMESGKIVSEDFLPKFARAITEMLGDAPEKAAERLDAAVNRMGNAWDRLKQTAGDSGVSRAIANDMNTLTETVSAMTDAMVRSRDQGGGALSQLASAAGVLIGRGALGGVASVAESVNAAINLLSGGVLKLSTNISVLPDSLRSNAEALAAVEDKLKRAEAEYEALAKQVEKVPNNAFIPSELGLLEMYIAKLRQARGELVGLTSDGNYGNEGRGATQRYAAEEAALAASRKRAKAYGDLVEKYATSDEKRSRALREARESLGEFFTPAVEKRISDSFAKGSGGGGSRGAARADKGAEMLARLDEQIAVKKADASATEKQTAAEQQRTRVIFEMDAGTLKVTASQREMIKGRLDDLVALEAQIKAQQEFTAAVERQEAANVRARQALHDQIESARTAADTYGLNTAQISAMTLARLEDARAMAEVNGAYPEQLAFLDEEIARRRELADALDEVELKRLLSGTKSAEAKRREADIARLDRAKAAGKVGDTEYDEALAKLKGSVDELDEFGKQAAQSMQTAFADFFFNPARKGFRQMAEDFAQAVAKMVANAGSAQLLRLLLGNDFSKTGDLGGLVGSLWKGASGSSGGFSSWFGGLFSGSGGGGGIDWGSYVVPSWHAGGLVVPGGQTSMRPVSPLLFANAERFHSGGWPGIRKDEVPAILQKGELVLTQQQQRAYARGAGSPSITVHVNSPAGDPAEIRRSASAGARSALSLMSGAGRYR